MQELLNPSISLRESSDQRRRRFVAMGCVIIGALSISACSASMDTEPMDPSIPVSSPEHSDLANVSSEPMEQIVAMTYNVDETVPVRDTLHYINQAMQGTRKILGVQELRGKDKETNSSNKAQYVKNHLLVCNNPAVCESDGYIPEGRGGAVSIFADNEEMRIIPEESTYVKLHGKKRILDKNSKEMVVYDKWLSIALIEDKTTGFRFAQANTHLVRDQQIGGKLNKEAPDILETLDQEMDTTESYLLQYLGAGYSVVLGMDANWDHDTKTIPASPPGRLAKIGFVSIYNAPGIKDRSPDINGTHYKPDNGEDPRNLDAIYIANPKNPVQPFVLEFVWRENYGPDAPSDHNIVAAGIDAVPNTLAFTAKLCAILPKESSYC